MKNKTTVIISFAAAMIIIIAFNLFIFNRILTSNFASDLESQLLLLGGNLQTQIKRITSLGIACRDIEGFDSQCLELIKKNQHISQAMVIDSQGIIIFHNSPARHGQLFPIQNISDYVQSGSEKILAYSEDTGSYYCAIIPFGDIAGSVNDYAVVVSASTAFVGRRVETILKAVCLSSFGVLIVLTAVFYVIISWVIDSKSQVKSVPVIAEKNTDIKTQACDGECKPHIWVWEVDITGRYTYSNSDVTALLGYSPDELVGKKHFYDLFILQERENLKVLAFEKFAEKAPFEDFINANLHKSGQVVWLATSGTPIFDEDGVLRGYRGQDVLLTERRMHLKPVGSAAGE